MRKLILLIALALISGSGAFAGSVTTFNSFTDWQNAVYGALSGHIVNTETFDGGWTQPTWTVEQDAPPHGSISGNVWDDTLSGTSYTRFRNFYMTAWGGDFVLDSGGATLRVTLGGTKGPYAAVPDITATGFFGLISTNPFDSVTLEAVGGGTQHYTLNNMVYNPEPSTYTLLGFGMLGLAYAARRRRR